MAGGTNWTRPLILLLCTVTAVTCAEAVSEDKDQVVSMEIGLDGSGKTSNSPSPDEDEEEDELDDFIEMDEPDTYYSSWENDEVKGLERWYAKESALLTEILTKVVFKKKTKYQKVEIVDAGRHGKSLVLDGMLQSSEADEFLYHEGIVHPAMLLHPNPKRVFIGGGGEGATSREVLKYKTVEKVVMVDLDEEVVDICKEHLPEHHQGSFNDSRHEVVFADAVGYLKNLPSDAPRFDVMILDFPDPVRGSPAYQLFTKEFYRLVRKSLGDNGLVVTQSGLVNMDELPDYAAIHATLRSVFPYVVGYAVPVPVFSDMHGFNMAGVNKTLKFHNLSDEEIEERIAERTTSKFRYVFPKSLSRMFALPAGVKKTLQQESHIFYKRDAESI